MVVRDFVGWCRMRGGGIVNCDLGHRMSDIDGGASLCIIGIVVHMHRFWALELVGYCCIVSLQSASDTVRCVLVMCTLAECIYQRYDKRLLIIICRLF